MRLCATQLAAALCLLGLAADGNAQHVMKLRPPPAADVDVAGARENAARYPELLTTVAPLPSARVTSRLQSFAEVLGPAPSFVERCSIFTAGQLFEPEAQQREKASAATDLLVRLEKDLDVESAETARRLEAEKAPLAPVHRQTLRMRRAEVAALLARTRDGIAARHGGAGDRWAEFLRSCFWADGSTALDELRGLLVAWHVDGDAPILGLDNLGLTYVNGTDSAPPLPNAGQQTVAYLSEGRAGTTLEDLTQNREIVLSPAVTAKATQLGGAKAITDFVRNECRLDWYHGVMKDTEATLADASGNDAELAGLLIALLRAKEIPARYVTGTIELPLERVAALMGFLTAAEGDQRTFTLDAARRAAVLAALTASGVPYQVNGGAVQLAHVWVEAYLPYANYRGQGTGDEGRQWVAIEPSFTGGAKYALTPGVVDVLTDMGQTPQSLTQAYLAAPPGTSFLTFLRARVDAHLQANRPGVTWEQVKARIVQRPEPLEFIPGSLPFKVSSVEGEYAFLPDSWVHQVQVQAIDAAGVVLTATVPLHRVTSHRTVWTYKAATQVDADAITSAGGLFNTSASAVRLVPALRIGGQEVGVGSRSFGLGESHLLVLQLQLPGGSLKRIENTVIAGNVIAVGVSAPRNSWVEPSAFQSGDADGQAPKRLYAIAANYANGWTDAENELAALLGTVLVRRTPGVVLVEYQLGVEETLGVRTRVIFKGLQMDADLRTATAVSTVAGRGAALMRLSGFEGSYLEGRALELGVGEESVSAVTVLQHATQQGVPVLTIDAANAGTQLPRLHAPAAVLREIQDAIARGREVRVPEIEIDVRDWTGTAFVVRDPVTEEGGYFLSGIVSGGMTVVSPNSWLDQQLLNELEQPNTPASTDAQDKVARIIELPLTTRIGDMGGGKRIDVLVTTQSGQPVRDATVHFTQHGTSRPKFVPVQLGAPTPTLDETMGTPSLEVTTDVTGMASVYVILDVKVDHGGFGVKCDRPDPQPCHRAPLGSYTPEDEIFGLTQVMAMAVRKLGPPEPTDELVSLPQPVLLLARPGKPEHVVLTRGSSGDEVAGIELLGSLFARVTDKWGNALANRATEWSQDGDGRFFRIAPGLVRLWDASDPSQSISFTTYSSSVGLSELGFVTPPTIPASGNVSVTAQVEPPVLPGTTATGTLSIPVRAAVKTLRLRSIDTQLGGIQGSDFASAVLLQAFERVDTEWQVITPSTPGVISYTGLHVTAAAGQLIQTTTRKADENLGFLVAPDDDTAVAFWPRHFTLPQPGQVDTFSVQIQEDSPQGPRLKCCADVITNEVDAPELEVIPAHLPVGGFVEELDGPVASAGDLKVGFRVRNSGASPVYLRLKQVTPNLIYLPGLNEVPRHPNDSSFIRLPPKVATDILFATKSPQGGSIEVEFHAFAPTESSPTQTRPLQHLTFAGEPGHTGPYVLQVAPATPVVKPLSGAEVATALGVEAKLAAIQNQSIDQLSISPSLTFPARTFESMAPNGPPVGPCDENQPVRADGAMALYINSSGTLRVHRGPPGSGTSAPVLATATVEANALRVISIVSSSPNVLFLHPKSRTPMVALEPGDPGGEEVTLALEPLGGGAPVVATAPIRTRILDLGALPIGHTFVKDVSVADGHLQKTFSDVSIPGRLPIELTRSYTSGGSERSPLGFGWTHSYRSAVIPAGVNLLETHKKWLVVGAQGGAQQFCCTADNSSCTPQRGYHGKLELAASTADGGVAEWQYTTKGGVGYRFENNSQQRYRLKSITDTTGEHHVDLEYSDVWDGEVKRIWAPGDQRFLEFAYDRGPKGVQLRHVQLMQNPQSQRLAPNQPGAPLTGELALCLNYDYADGTGNVTAVRRSRDCDEPGSPSPALRKETFTYQANESTPELQNNITQYVDPNGATTTYEYLTPSTPIAGSSSWVYFTNEAKKERIGDVVEHLGATQLRTHFAYELTQAPVGEGLTPITAYKTHVKPPRPNVPPTTYFMGAAGAVVHTERPVSATAFARTEQRLNQDRLVIEELDSHGRLTQMKYDARGNLVERRISTGPLSPLGPGDTATEPVNAHGQSVSQSVEKWDYDPDFNLVKCHIDPEGRGQLRTIALGRVLETRRVAQRVTYDALSAVVTAHGSTSDCVALLTPLQSGADIITQSAYNGVGSSPGPSTAGSLVGDLTRSTDGNGNTTTRSSFDIFGNARHEVLAGAGNVSVTTDHDFDARGRLSKTSDSMGHVTVRGYDGLDRVTLVDRQNDVGATGLAAPRGQKTTYEYFPGGQLKRETNGLPPGDFAFASKEFQLDELNRVKLVTETGSFGTLTTFQTWDENGNLRTRRDRRGVTTTTDYDEADRPFRVTVAVTSPAAGDPAPSNLYASSGGEPGSAVGQAGVVRLMEYDSVGNKLSETNAQGHKTTFALDSLYRVVGTTSPQVPGPSLSAPAQTWTTRRTFELTGAVLTEVDGNEHSTATEYDGFGRLKSRTDAVGQRTERDYDKNGNVIAERLETGPDTAPKTHRLYEVGATGAPGYDGLNRLLDTKETFALADGGTDVRTTSVRYSDANGAHFQVRRDERGFLTRQTLDDLDRPYETVVDDSAALGLSRPSGAAPALRLSTAVSFDGAGRKLELRDARGNTVTEHTDGLGRLRSRELPLGFSESFEYDGEGNQIAHVDTRGVRRETSRDALARERKAKLFEGSQPLVVREVRYHDVPVSGLNRRSEEDARGNTTEHFIDGLGREVRVEDAFNGASAPKQLRYDAKVLREQRDNKGYVTRFTYDDIDRLKLQEDLDVSPGTLHYRQATRYDVAARTVTRVDRSCIQTVSQLDGLGRVEVTVRSGMTGAMASERPDCTVSTSSLKQVEVTRFDAAGNPTSVVDANGNVTERKFDGAGRRIEETRGANVPAQAEVTKYGLDEAGNVVSVAKGRLPAGTFDVLNTYDVLNRLVRVEDALGNVTFNAYDGTGNVLCVKAPKGQGGTPYSHGAAPATRTALEAAACNGTFVTRYAYEEAGKLVELIDALGGQYQYVYDETRNLIGKQDANGHSTTYVFDALNRRTREHQHLGPTACDTSFTRSCIASLNAAVSPPNVDFTAGALTWATTYDANSNVATTFDPKGQSCLHSFGLLNRLASQSYTHVGARELPSIDSITYAYTPNGSLQTVIETKTTFTGPLLEQTTRGFDALERMTSQTRDYGSTQKTTLFGYDVKGNRTSVTDFTGAGTVYTFDSVDRLKTATTPNGIATHVYFADGLLQRTEYRASAGAPVTTLEKRCYDNASRLTTVASGPPNFMGDDCPATMGPVVFSRFDYGLDANGNRVTQREQRASTDELTDYGYDALDRLVAVAYPSETVLYQLDAVGNRTGEKKTTRAAVQALGLVAAAFAALAPADTLANVRGDFNRADWLTARRTLSANGLSELSRIDFAHDANGNTTAEDSATSSRAYRWDARNTLTAAFIDGLDVGRYSYDWQLQRVSRTAGGSTVEYVLDDKLVLQELDGAGHAATRRYHFGALSPLGVSDSGGPRWLLNDGLGSVSDEVTPSGALFKQRQYNAWGEYRNSTAPALTEPKLGYEGHQFDPETSLTYARARYLDNRHGILLSRDVVEGSINDAPSLHRYSWVRVGPLRFTDFSGNDVGQASRLQREYELAKLRELTFNKPPLFPQEAWKLWRSTTTLTAKEILDQTKGHGTDARTQWMSIVSLERWAVLGERFFGDRPHDIDALDETFRAHAAVVRNVNDALALGGGASVPPGPALSEAVAVEGSVRTGSGIAPRVPVPPLNVMASSGSKGTAGSENPSEATAADSATAPETQAKKPREKAMAQAGDAVTVSGWGKKPPGATSVSPEEVLDYSKQIGHEPKAAGPLDQGVKGRYYSSHAEKQSALARPGQPTEVTIEMCQDCQDWYSKRAVHENRTEVVKDPEFTRFFNPDGTVTVTK